VLSSLASIIAVIGPNWNFCEFCILKKKCKLKWRKYNVSKCQEHNTLCYCWHIVPPLHFCYFWRYCTFDKVSLRNLKTCLSNIANEINFVSLKSAKLKWFKIQNFWKITEFKCCEICAPQIAKMSCNRVANHNAWLVKFFLASNI